MASDCELNDGLNLLAVEAVEPFDDVIDICAGFQIFEDRGNRRPRSLKDPRSAELAGDAFDRGTLRPIEYPHIFYPSASDKQSVERRRETRLKANQPVVVTALGLMGMPPIYGRVLDMSGSGLRLRLPNPLPCGSPVKVESEHLVMVGEVSRCEEQGEGYSVGMMLFHVTPTPEKPGRAIMGV